MRVFKIVGVLLLVAVFAFVGCSDDDKDKIIGPSFDEGTLTAGTDGANEAISADYAPQFAALIMAKSNEIYGRAMQAQYAKVASQVISGRVDGDSLGYAEVSGSFSESATGESMSITCTYHNFSDDGELFMGGSMNIDSSYNYSTNVSTTTITSAIKFAGSYSGTMTYTLSIDYDEETYEPIFTGTFSITSGGETYTGNFEDLASLKIL